MAQFNHNPAHRDDDGPRHNHFTRHSVPSRAPTKTPAAEININEPHISTVQLLQKLGVEDSSTPSVTDVTVVSDNVRTEKAISQQIEG